MSNDLTLLYVEDNKEVRENFEEIFSIYFKNIISTDNGKSALELYKNNHIDIAILDISIPEINGLNVAKKIREKNSDIEIIMLTAYSDQDKLLKAVNLQLFSYLLKPIEQNELSMTIEKVIKKLSKSSKIELGYGYHWDLYSEILVYKNENIKITKNEKKLLKFLSVNKNKYYTANEISHELFNFHDNNINSNNVIKLISRFKKKMLNLHNKEYFFIDNVYGLGYKISI